MEFHIELLHAIVDHLHLVITPHPSSHQSDQKHKNKTKFELRVVEAKTIILVHANHTKNTNKTKIEYKQLLRLRKLYREAIDGVIYNNHPK
jgi:hypothetical protein